MADPLEDVLRLVAEGRLTPAEAAPIIDALSRHRDGGARAGGGGVRAAASGGESNRPPGDAPAPGTGSASGRAPRIRIEVRDGGRTVVDLQVPGFLSELAQALPGIPSAYAEQVRSALRAGTRGRILDVNDEDGSGISITVE